MKPWRSAAWMVVAVVAAVLALLLVRRQGEEAPDSGARPAVRASPRTVEGSRGQAARAPADGGRVVPRSASGDARANDGGAVSLRAVTSMFEVSRILHRNAEEAAANVERYCEAAARLPKRIFATPPAVDPDDAESQTRDAAYFLNSLIDWDTRPRTRGRLDLPRALEDRIYAAHGDWPTVLTVSDTAGIDFSWLPQLSPFDHWSLATIGPMAASAATVDPFNAPIPYYKLFDEYAKLRFVRALAVGDVAEALKDVGHLADLIHSNGIQIGDFAAGWITRDETAFVAAAAQRGFTLDHPTPSFDAATEEAFHDVAFAGVAFMFPGVDDAVSKRALSCMPSPCVGLGEWVTMRREMDLFTDTAEDQNSWSLADKSSCDQTLFALLKTSPSSGDEAVAGFIGGEPLPLERLFPELKPVAR